MSKQRTFYLNLLVILLCILIPSVIIWISSFRMIDRYEAVIRDFDRVDGTLNEVFLVGEGSPHDETFYVKGEFSYEIDEIKYTSRNMGYFDTKLVELCGPDESKLSTILGIKKGSTYSIYVNPNDNTDAIFWVDLTSLKHQLKWVQIILPGLFITLIFLLYQVHFKQKKYKEDQ